MSELLADIRSIGELRERIPEVEARLKVFIDYLISSEQMFLNVLADAQAGVAPRPPASDIEGDLEFGLYLYWLSHPVDYFEADLSQSPAHVTATMALRHFTPTSLVGTNDFEWFQQSAYDDGIVAADGTLWTLGKYAQLDMYWLTAGINYAINLLDPDSIAHPYPGPNQAYNSTIGDGQEHLSIAIIGDWGTGPYGQEFGGQGPAVAVMNAVRNLSPDCTVHLGDVYYCGTNADRHPINEEQDNLLAPWNSGLTAPGRNFTINSNHEMYGAAKGLIDVALSSTTPFAHQNKTPYFALHFGAWVVIGLDSAYFDPSSLYMKGALGNADNTQQKQFVQSLGDLTDKKVLVMTHHNPMSYDGKTITPNKAAGARLWDAMIDLLGKQPDVWYWGHLHLGVAYNADSVLGAKGTMCRCVGHSAIPFGNAHGMDTQNVDYYAHTELSQGSKQVQNGFVMLRLDVNGSFSEIFYEVTSNGDCVEGWQSPTGALQKKSPQT